MEDEYEEELQFLVKLMRYKLKLRGHRGKEWKSVTIERLLALLRDEVRELEVSMIEGGSSGDIVYECADIANYAMMIADVVRMGEENDRKI